MVIGVGGESPQHCQCAHNTTVAHLSADERFVPHHVPHGSVGIVLLSPDTDVFCTGTLLLENPTPTALQN